MQWIKENSPCPRFRFPSLANACLVHSRRGWGIGKTITEENKIIPVIVFSFPVAVEIILFPNFFARLFPNVFLAFEMFFCLFFFI